MIKIFKWLGCLPEKIASLFEEEQVPFRSRRVASNGITYRTPNEASKGASKVESVSKTSKNYSGRSESTANESQLFLRSSVRKNRILNYQ